jgi:hypothetical protein
METNPVFQGVNQKLFLLAVKELHHSFAADQGARSFLSHTPRGAAWKQAGPIFLVKPTRFGPVPMPVVPSGTRRARWEG